MATAIFAAIFAVVAGVAAMVLVALLGRAIKQSLRPEIRIAGAAVAALTFVILIQPRVLERLTGGYLSFKSGRERLRDYMDDFGVRLAHEPEVRRALESPEYIGRDPLVLSRRGNERLDDATILQRALIFDRLLSALDEKTCAAMFRGDEGDTPEVRKRVGEVMLGMDAATVIAFLEIWRKATLAEARKVPAPTVTDEEAAAAWEALRQRVGAEGARRLRAGLADSASDADLCYAMRAVYRYGPTLPQPHQRVLLRLVVAYP